MLFRLTGLFLTLNTIALQIFAQVVCPPNLPLTLMGTTEYCIGTPGAELYVSQLYAGYEWLPTAEAGQNVVLTAGDYQVVVTHYLGCTDTLDFEVEQVSNPPQPIITATGATQFCQGGSVLLTATEGYPYYEWNSGSVSEDITVFESGTYMVSIEDWNGCVSSSNSVQITVDPLPVAAFSPNLNMFDVSFNNSSEYATGFEWNFGDGNYSSDFEPTHTYTANEPTSIWLVASNDCGTDTAFWDLLSVDVEENKDLINFNIYPNPNTGNFTINLPSDTQEPIQVSIYNGYGQMIYQKDVIVPMGSSEHTVNLVDVASGAYLLELSSAGSIASQRLLIQR